MKMPLLQVKKSDQGVSLSKEITRSEYKKPMIDIEKALEKSINILSVTFEAKHPPLTRIELEGFVEEKDEYSELLNDKEHFQIIMIRGTFKVEDEYIPMEIHANGIIKIPTNVTIEQKGKIKRFLQGLIISNNEGYF